MDIEKEFKDLTDVVEEAGALARDYFYSDINPNTQKADGTVVTEIDQKAEAMLRAHIAERFPDDAIVGEEEGASEGKSGFVWYIDPIDGTDNFIRKIPFFAVAATRLGNDPEGSMAIIHNPVSRQTFASLRENDTYENEHLCNLTPDTIGGRYLLVVEGMSKNGPWVKSARSKLWGALYERFGRSYAFQSTLLEFAYVAAGRIDGFLSMEFDPWDTAAGLYLVKAAGGAISVHTKEGWKRWDGPIKELYGTSGVERATIFVSHPDIHQNVLDFIGDPSAWA